MRPSGAGWRTWEWLFSPAAPRCEPDLLGAGSGGFDEEKALSVIIDELEHLQFTCEVVLVRYKR